MYDRYEMQSFSLSFALTLFIESSTLQLIVWKEKKGMCRLKDLQILTELMLGSRRGQRCEDACCPDYEAEIENLET